MTKKNPMIEAERASWLQLLCAGSGTAADRRNQLRFVAWLAGWAVAFVGVNWILQANPEFRGAGAWALALLPNVFSIAALFAYLHFLRSADELIRRIQLEGLAIGFGAAVIFMIGYPPLERIGLPVLEADTVLIVMMIGWVAGQMVAAWRYR